MIAPKLNRNFHKPVVAAIEQVSLVEKSGSVAQFLGTVIEAHGPDAAWGERCTIWSDCATAQLTAEVIGIKDGRVLLMPYGQPKGISLGSKITATGEVSVIGVGEGLLGRVIDVFGRPIDGGPAISCNSYRPLLCEPVNAFQRPPIDTVLETGVRAIDSLATVGRGQRMGIFAGSGVGKSTLLGMICRNMDADVNVIALIGERGREVADFIQNVLGKEGLARSVVVVATSDQSALERSHAAFAATSIAEYFRDTGRDVVLTMDSVTRFAMAQREIGLAIGEPPTNRGYTPSVFSNLPRLLERCGNFSQGSITAFYTVLVEADDDINDPIADHVRAILDGSIVLSRQLANRRHFPPINVLHSNSRLFNALATEEEQALATLLVKAMADYDSARDLIEMGAYKKGTNQHIDNLMGFIPEIESFLTQNVNEQVPRKLCMQRLAMLMRTAKKVTGAPT